MEGALRLRPFRKTLRLVGCKESTESNLNPCKGKTVPDSRTLDCRGDGRLGAGCGGGGLGAGCGGGGLGAGCGGGGLGAGCGGGGLGAGCGGGGLGAGCGGGGLGAGCGGGVGFVPGLGGCVVLWSPSASTPSRSDRIISSAFCLDVGSPTYV